MRHLILTLSLILGLATSVSAEWKTLDYEQSYEILFNGKHLSSGFGLGMNESTDWESFVSLVRYENELYRCRLDANDRDERWALVCKHITKTYQGRRPIKD